MVSCIACGISHKARKQGILFHRFPKNAEQRATWLKFVKKEEKEIPRFCYLCSQHFNENDFDKTSALKVQLRKNAIPTNIIHRPKYSRTAESVKFKTSILNNGNASTDPIGNLNFSNKMSESISNKSRTTLHVTESRVLDSQHFLLLPKPCDSVMKPSTSDELEMLKERKLKEEIRQMTVRDLYKSKQIRRLQKLNWAQKTRILKLTNIIKHLKQRDFDDEVCFTTTAEGIHNQNLDNKAFKIKEKIGSKT